MKQPPSTLTPLPPAQVAAFRSAIEGPAMTICPQYGLDPARCVAEAAEVSGYGRFVVAYNWWNLRGVGSRGCYYAVVAPLNGESAHGGVRPMAERRAKFGSPEEAVSAWCKSKGA